MCRHAQRGVTLLELMLVIALLGVIAAVVWPSFTGFAADRHLDESARRMRALISMCRAEAMNRTARHQVRIRRDGSVSVRRQADPFRAPHLYITPRAGWARTQILMDDVWVESFQLLPEGPPPIRIIDEDLVFPETEVELTSVEDLELPLEINIEPDGSSNSLRWVLRHEDGRALLLTLDGRLGRMQTEPWEAVPSEDLQRPEPLEQDEDLEDEYSAEDWQ
jgi:type II secretion system protein H